DIPAEITAIAVNRNNRSSMSNSNSTSVGGEMNIMRRFYKAGRNISLRPAATTHRATTTATA
ncbi:MAG: hypothetical protein IKN51_04555, partial [Bacteroidaceae bacterium]|nr:hypothetical protein [Bacteroidaceae bacterium]